MLEPRTSCAYAAVLGGKGWGSHCPQKTNYRVILLFITRVKNQPRCCVEYGCPVKT